MALIAFLAPFYLLIAAILDGANGAVGTVTLSNVKQTIQGFGASSAWQGAVPEPAMNSLYVEFNHKNYNFKICRCLNINMNK
jgi:O-glycosyl hydrolase